MKITLQVEKEFDIKELLVEAKVRYWEDAKVNDIEDVEGGLIPCRSNDIWCPIIDIETGIIKNWEIGKVAEIHYKVCDEGIYTLRDEKGEIIKRLEGYVIDCLSIGQNGFGDYIILNVDTSGKIEDWDADFDDFIKLSND
ncbi:hypothetical protein CLU96_1257 [Chryseobacterium sp. 52]|uniref:hypothetical protein n=1 Tax=Chryseobacterium sp. 52 TaxID=2035213 RepID=UPI000C179A19|nr:hypothetical protein [Chryseobacterium sp. 52]PIF44314.1 hypothetical protein CLU96_1257 [Chryseobacterium sp. 52]